MKLLNCFLFLFAFISVATNATSAQIACVRGDAPVEVQGSITSDDNAQLGRIVRDGAASSCAGDTATLENNTFRRRDTHNFQNPYNETVCVRVEVDFTGCGGNQTQAVAYSSFTPTLPANNVIGDLGFSTIGKGSFSFSVGPNASFSVGVNEVDPGTGCPLYKLKVTYLRNCRQAGTDLTNDGLADPTIFRASNGVGAWYSLDSETGQPVIKAFGTSSDFPTGGSDYTGDGKTDLSVYRTGNHTWYYSTNLDSPGSNFVGQPWGLNGDKPVPGDFDGDGKNDIAIFRPGNGTFYVLRSSDGSLQTRQWGAPGDTPISGDFDGDAMTDFAIARNNGSLKYWWILKSNFNYGFDEVVHWGTDTDRIATGDYDGDGITDPAVFRNASGTFYVFRSTDRQMQTFRWGSPGDVPQPADYDGDRKQDFAIYRPSNGTWYISNSGSGTTRIVNWGLQFDQPMTTSYKIDGAQEIAQTLTGGE
jgi:hypothetical protein